MIPARAEVVVIGAGVVGASVAYHLAQAGVRDVVVLDRAAELGAGSTGRATGGFRCQFATAVNVRLSLLAREKLIRFRDETGVDAGYDPCGYLFLARSTDDLALLRAAITVAHRAGLGEAREVDPGDIRHLNPAVADNGLLGGSFCPSDGFLRPLAVLAGYRAAATRLGARFEHGVAVTGLRLAATQERIAAVETSAGTIAASEVVDAAGAWAGSVARLAGVDLPVTPLRRQVAPTLATEVMPERMPMTIFTEDGFHLRVRDGRVLLLWPTAPGPGDPFDDGFDPAWLEGLTARAHLRLPVLRGIAIDRAACWAGLYEMSPDKHAILDRAPGVENLHLVNGSSGHGVMHAPALGQLAAEILLQGDAHTLDAHALRPARFAEGEPNPASDVL